MNIYLIAVGTKMPAWVNQGFTEYAKRLQHDCKLILREVPAAKRDKQTTHSAAQIERLLEKERLAINKALPKNVYQVALEVNGTAHTTEKLADKLNSWMHQGQDVALLVGGPEGLPPALSQAANETWSLSSLTLPHPLVRVMLAEALYRAWTYKNGHPYHRAD